MLPSVGGDKHTKITEAISYMIVKDNMPFSTVNKEGFNRLMKVLAPNYKVPSNDTITSAIDKKYEVLKPIKKEKLKHIPYMSLTCDLWTEEHNKTSIFGVTGHYIQNGQLESVLLGENFRTYFYKMNLKCIILL